MSRSRRKTPKAGITNSASEKDDKRLASRRQRRWVGSHLGPQVAANDEFDLPEEYEHRRSGQWTFNKDGKVWLGISRRFDVAKWLRK